MWDKRSMLIYHRISGMAARRSIHGGESRGRFETVSGMNTYITSPRQGTANGNIVLYFPDVWGFFPNGFLIMDGFADAGYQVLGPDYFRGVRF